MSNSRTVVSAAGTTESAQPFGAPPCGGPTPTPLALLIEDDVCVADIVEHILARHGHRVMRARNGAEGSQLFAAHERDVTLIFLDCGLPDIDGVALARVLRGLAPKLPIILTSGWDSAPARALVGKGPTVFLQKPFFPADVLKVVNAFAIAKS